MLDTDTVSFAVRGEGRVGPKIVEHRPSELCISAITLAELRFGVERRKSARLDRTITALLSNLAVMPFDDDCAVTFGRIASKLAETGSPIGDLDALIAAHAIALDVTLVTNNAKHFARIPGLHVENWL
jgi:tRNA(fMet)-specific endonuclease VapC